MEMTAFHETLCKRLDGPDGYFQTALQTEMGCMKWSAEWFVVQSLHSASIALFFLVI